MVLCLALDLALGCNTLTSKNAISIGDHRPLAAMSSLAPSSRQVPLRRLSPVHGDIILSKLKYQYKIDGRLLKFLVNYLQGRSQRVVINESVSGNREVESGVPQGSILGPLLFVLFINVSCVSSGTEIALYADDTKIWRKIESWDDHLALQEDINSLHSWSIQNKMKFHPLKCKVLRVTLNHIEDYKTIPLPHCIFHYQMNGVYLDFVDSEKDLGVLMSTKLSWSDQCIAQCSKASSRLGLVKRTCHFVICYRQKRVLYLSLVRSIFDHACIVWRPCSENLLGKFEKIQNELLSGYSLNRTTTMETMSTLEGSRTLIFSPLSLDSSSVT